MRRGGGKGGGEGRVSEVGRVGRGGKRVEGRIRKRGKGG